MGALKALSRVQAPVDSNNVLGYTTKQEMDAAIAAYVANYPRGRIGTSKLTTTTNFTTTQTVVDSITATLVSGRRYKAIWRGGIATNQAGGTDIVGFLRFKLTSTVDTTGTAFDARDMGSVTDANNVPQLLIGDFVAASSGTHVVAACWQIAGTGTGTVAYGATNNHRYLILEDCGV